MARKGRFMKFLVEEALREKSAVCRKILGLLPQWFELPEARKRYIQGVETKPMFCCRLNETKEIVGFLSLHDTSDSAAEIYVMGVMPDYHHQGIGTALVEAASSYAAEMGRVYLTVKTLSPEHPDPHYAVTRRFYEKVGFMPLETFPTLWGPENPCLLMRKILREGQVPPGPKKRRKITRTPCNAPGLPRRFAPRNDRNGWGERVLQFFTSLYKTR